MKKAYIAFPLKGCGVPGSKKARKAKKFSSTSGKNKCKRCRADWRQRDWAKRSRSYKDANFATMSVSMDRRAADLAEK